MKQELTILTHTRTGLPLPLARPLLSEIFRSFGLTTADIA